MPPKKKTKSISPKSITFLLNDAENQIILSKKRTLLKNGTESLKRPAKRAISATGCSLLDIQQKIETLDEQSKKLSKQLEALQQQVSELPSKETHFDWDTPFLAIEKANKPLKSAPSSLLEPRFITASSQKIAYDPRHFQWNIDVEKQYSFEGDLNCSEVEEEFDLNLDSLFTS